MRSESDSTSTPALRLAGVTKRFGTTTAVDDVSLAVRSGSIHALLGENGAGKTTLMRIAFGMIEPDAGRIFVSERERRFESPGDALAAGIGMVHQHFTNVPAMTVAENVALGRSGRYDAREAEDRVRTIGERTGLTLDPRAIAGDLPVGAQQRLEILKALARSASVLILDEPTAVLAPAESDDLLRWLRGFADAGNAVVLITHKLREALSVSDDVTVMRRGKPALVAKSADVSPDSLATAIVGERLADRLDIPLPSTSTAPVIATLDAVHVVDNRGVTTVQNASLSVRRGEIVGIAAVEGAGQRELLRMLARRTQPASGTCTLPDVVGFIPEDRHQDALVLDFSQTENVALKDAGGRRGIMRWSEQRELTRRLATEFDVRGGDPDRAVRALSGGNQQKLVLARELAREPVLVVAENPTRGLDIRATADVHARLRAAAHNGAAVVVYSSDLDEVMGLATRLVVMHAGRLREVTRDRDTVGRAMLGVA